MTPAGINYPATPGNVDESVIKPSSEFKKEVVSVTGTILFFVVVYLLLVLLGGALAALCAFGGIMLIVALPKFITLMLGVGLIGLGVMVLFFLVKFIFKQNKVDRSGLIEVTEKDQPELFQFIRTLTRETQAPFPKKIFLSADVNACVFYDSGFWSMFLPVRKNLQIGLGLVNSVNMSEFKAILAHEFGHFSQRSMKLGSYVYNVNRVIYNLLYENDNYAITLEKWASISGYFALFAGLTNGIVRGIQWILQQIYQLINKTYMSLSRQMEFHADAVAAYVTGSDHLVTSLRRLEVADSCYNRLFQCYNGWLKENLKPDNLYPHHIEVMHHFATDHDIPVKHGLLQVTSSTFSKFNQHRLMIKDQWASHPSTDDREAHLNRLNIRTAPMNISAWTIFSNAENLQREMTTMIYHQANFSAPPEVLTNEKFKEKYYNEVNRYHLDSRYKGYFNNKEIKPFDLDSQFGVQSDDTFEGVLSDEVALLPLKIDGLESDIQGLEQIVNKNIPVKTFDYDGQRYARSEAKGIQTRLKAELDHRMKQLEEADQKLYGFFLKEAGKKGVAEKLKSDYKNLFEVIRIGDEDWKQYADIVEIMNPIYEGRVAFETVNAIMNQVSRRERDLKTRMKEMLSDPSYNQYIDDEMRKNMERHVSWERAHFTGDAFDEESLGVLNQALGDYREIILNKNHLVKKELLDWQLTLLN